MKKEAQQKHTAGAATEPKTPKTPRTPRAQKTPKTQKTQRTPRAHKTQKTKCSSSGSGNATDTADSTTKTPRARKTQQPAAASENKRTGTKSPTGSKLPTNRSEQQQQQQQQQLERKGKRRRASSPVRPRKSAKKGAAAATAANGDLDLHVFFSNRLNAHEADVTRFVPGEEDRLAFEEARASASLLEASETGMHGPAVDPSVTPSTPNGAGSTGVGYQVKKIRLGACEIESWYISPYPEEYSRHPMLYICEYCLKYIKSQYTYKRHCMKCTVRHPPGDEIYRSGSISVFEVDGRKNKIYCQNLCLIGKMFLDTKTLYYDVEPFLFYVLCEYDSAGYHFAGYYSKEKRSSQGYNLSCIMILPSKQREGYGKLLIEFSYLLSRKEGLSGSPEKPLSDFGLLSYRSYWRRAVYEAVLAVHSNGSPGSRRLSIRDISRATGMTCDDVVSTLQTDGMLQRAPQGASYCIALDAARMQGYLAEAKAKNPRRIDPEKLRWAPFLTKASSSMAPAAAPTNGLDTSADEAAPDEEVNVEG